MFLDSNDSQAIPPLGTIASILSHHPVGERSVAHGGARSGRPGSRFISALFGAAVAFIASAAPAQEGVPQLSPTIRPILTSSDPAGDELVTCYVLPKTAPNGYRDSPEAVPDACAVQVTDTLQIEAGNDPERPTPQFVVDVLLGPQNEVVTPPSHAIEGVYLSPGTRLGVYRFRGHVGPQPVAGGFTIRPPSKRILQLRYANEPQQTGAYAALAGYPPGAAVPVDIYSQISFRPDVGTGERKWRYVQKIGEVTVNERGEGLFQLPFDVHRVRGNFLLATEPLQENDFFSGCHVADSP